jgi:hypothetical protein
MWSLAIVALTALAPQDPSPPSPERLEPPTDAEYAAWLADMTGGTRREEMLTDRALERAIRAIPRESIAEDLLPVLEAPEAAARTRLEERIRTDHGGNREAWVLQIAEQGLTPDEALRTATVFALREARTAVLVRRTRRIAESDVERVFEERFGPSGIRTTARQVLISFAGVRERVEAARRGPPLAEEAVHRLAREEALRIREGAVAAGGLEGLGAQPVPDGLARFAGRTFQQALGSLAIGEVSQPIETRFGVHLLEVEGRTTTRLEDVAAGLREDLERAPPSLAERRAVLAELDATYGIRDAARQRVPR